MQLQAVSNFCALLDGICTHRENFEAQPRRSDRLKIVRFREEGEYFVDWPRNPLLLPVNIDSGTHMMYGLIIGMFRLEVERDRFDLF